MNNNFSERIKKCFGFGHPELAKIGYNIKQFIEGKITFDKLTEYLNKGDKENIIKVLDYTKCPDGVPSYVFDKYMTKIKNYLNFN